MSYLKKIFLFVAIFSFSCSPQNMKIYKVGIDPNLPSLQFSPMVPYVTGFLKDYLLQVAKNHKLAFEQMDEDNMYLFRGLDQKKYDVILSSMPPFNFHEKSYMFSDVIIPIGPTLVLRKEMEASSLEDLSHKIIAVQESDLPKLDLSGYPNINIRVYSSNLTALNDVIQQKIDAALIRYIPAVSYIEDTFYEKLKIVGAPLNDQGLRFVSLKENQQLVSTLNQTLQRMKKQSSFKELLMKWGVEVPQKK